MVHVADAVVIPFSSTFASLSSAKTYLSLICCLQRKHESLILRYFYSPCEWHCTPHNFYAKQVCAEVCSPPMSMFVSTVSAEDTAGAAAPTPGATLDARAASNANDKTRKCGAVARDAPDGKTPSAGDGGATPDPLFASNPLSPNIYMDPGRVSLYRSLGLIVGLAVRAGVPLPSLRLSPMWWMLVANEAASALMDVATADESMVRLSTTAEGSERTRGTESEAEAADGGKSRPSCLGEAVSVSDDVTDKGKTSSSELDGVLAALERIREAAAGKDKLEEVLADARFVAPLSSGQMVELVPGGERSQERGVGTHATGSTLGVHLSTVFRSPAADRTIVIGCVYVLPMAKAGRRFRSMQITSQQLINKQSFLFPALPPHRFRAKG